MAVQANLEVSFGRHPLVDPRLLTAARALCAQSTDELKAVQLQRLADFHGPPVLSPQSEVFEVLPCACVFYKPGMLQKWGACAAE